MKREKKEIHEPPMVPVLGRNMAFYKKLSYEYVKKKLKFFYIIKLRELNR